MNNLKQLLSSFLLKHIELSDEVLDVIFRTLPVKTYAKNTVLLQAGNPCNECYFIIKGLVRSYRLKEDLEEITTDFYIEEESVTPPCYGKNELSELYFQCMEDTVAIIGTPDLETDLFEQYPELETMARIMADKMLESYKDSFHRFKMSTPEERYQQLVQQKPELIQRVPQYYIASYLGMKPESLSRIRRRLAGK